MRSRRFIIEVEGFEGREGEILVTNDRGARGYSLGRPDVLFCVGSMGTDGVIQFLDWGYATIEEAREAWPEAVDANGSDTT